MSTIASPRSDAGIQRWAALAGVAYVVLFLVGVILTYSGAVDTSAAPAKVIAYYSDSGHRDRVNFGWLIAGLGVFLFLWFLSALRQAVRRLEADDGFLTGLTTIGGVVYATLTLAALAVETGIRTMSDDTYHHTVYPGLIHAADDVSWVLHASGGAGLAAMIVAASLAALRARAVPTWAGWLGIVVGILGLGLIAFFPWFLVAIWILVVSIGMFVRAGRAPRGCRLAHTLSGPASAGPDGHFWPIPLRLGLHRASTWSAQRLPSTVRELVEGGVFLWLQEQ